MKKIRLILIEDNRLLREGITSFLNKEADITVIRAFSDSDFTIEMLKALNPHIALIDLGLANQNSYDLVKALLENCPDTKIIIMDLVPVQDDVLKFVKEGVAGFILKDARTTDFLKTIRNVYNGVKVLPSSLTGSLFSQIVDYGLNELGVKKVIKAVNMTKREHEIVDLIAQGFANKEIAYRLNISIYTVKSHVHNILEKMALNTRVQIAIYSKTEERKSGKA